jgi:hypothetical protein
MSPSCIREPPCADLASWRGGWLHPAAKLGMKRRRSDCGEGRSRSAAKSRPRTIVERMMRGAVIWYSSLA